VHVHKIAAEKNASNDNCGAEIVNEADWRARDGQLDEDFEAVTQVSGLAECEQKPSMVASIVPRVVCSAASWVFAASLTPASA
jgi:hypothetical protein